MDKLLNKVGQNIKKYREARSITQNELSEVCGLHRNYVSSVERGERNLSLNTLEKIASGLNIKAKDLLE
jgi:transcriptional regulator with XRE-family HTH domain